MYIASDYGLPPVPIGWLFAVILLNIGSSLLISGITMGVHNSIKKKGQWFMFGFIGVAFLVLGARTYILHPYETPKCLCKAGFYGEDCKPCACVNGICNDGNEGSGRCLCDNGWDGEKCDRCGRTFEGDNCDKCIRGWDGNECDECYPGYVGPNCDFCHPNWLSEYDLYGTLCRYCKTGYYGPFCTKCPTCDTHNKGSFCQDNDWWRDNKYDSTVCTTTGQICENDYDCSSYNCKGRCVIDDQFTGQNCEVDIQCNPGTCQFKTCCVESKFGSGECKCTRNGYWGPLCEPCPGFDGIYSASICTGHGTCSAAYVGDDVFSHLTCECNTENEAIWSGNQCGCLEENGECTKCADGFFGNKCTVCPGGGGISQCSLHGTCSDGLTGDGTCSCDLDIKPNGLGGWKTSDTGSCDVCYSEHDFYGDNCNICLSTKVVGPTLSKRKSDNRDNTLLPDGNYLFTCPVKDQSCNDNGGCSDL